MSCRLCAELCWPATLGKQLLQARIMLNMHMYADASVTAAPRRMLDSCTGWSEMYDQCGGISCKNGGTTCSDSAYNCCPTETSCQRQNQWYWQCLPEPVSPTVQAVSTDNTSPSPGMWSLQPAHQYLIDVSNTAWLTMLALHRWAATDCQVSHHAICHVQ